MFNLILFGPPGSGKGTQSAKIAEKYGLVHISTGDIFRNEIKQQTELGVKFKSLVEKGELVPDELIIDILDSALHKYQNINGFVFDGFPRTLNQSGELDNLLKKDKESVTLVLALDVNDNEVVTRLLKRAQIEDRKDDSEDVIKNRLQVYKDQTYPLIDLYKKQNKFVGIKGIGSIDEIFGNICGEIDKKV